MEEGEGMSKPSDGLGLGEGQGERDVSDKIESEDQLDDAQPAGQEKQKDEDKDCKEEEKGIEMSEDFDSKLQVSCTKCFIYFYSNIYILGQGKSRR